MKEPMGSKKPAAKIKVSQATIDKIKKMGMTKALAGTKSANPEMKEALTRMYGARRVAAAANASAPKPTPRGAMVDMGGSRKPVSSKPSTKKSTDAMKPTAQQMAQAKARAGGNPNLSMPKSAPKATETPAQKAAKAALKQKQRAAAASAVKRAGGRTM